MIVMLVEDDEFKAADISRVVNENISAVVISRAASVNSALRGITSTQSDLIILDMSLPTFDLSGPGGGGSPQSQGGIEVLRLAKRLGRRAPFIIITQYPGIEIDSVEFPLAQAAKKLSARFEIEVIACIGYDFESDAWRSHLIQALERNSARG